MAKRGKPIWTIDSETDPFKKGRIPEPFIWGVYTGEEYWEYTNTQKMIEDISDYEAICYAHNGGKFDWHFLTEWISDFEPLTIINGRLAKFSIGNLELRDSFNIIPAPLSAYQKDEIDYAIFEKGEREKPENWEKIRSYLKSDCIYLHEMVTQFIDDYGMNLTQAGAAMKVWAKQSGIKKPQTNQAYYQELSKFYYGGRVECFKTGIIEKPFKVVDIRSAYPFAMTHDHPWGTDYAIYDEISEELENDRERLSRCFLSVEAVSDGAFPYRTKSGLAFPSDGETRLYHITGWEYLAARDTKTARIYSVKEVLEYLDCINFEQYVTHFFAMKAEADEMLKVYSSSHSEYPYWVARRLFAKLFLNSLYGKFASNPENYEEFMTIPASMIDGAAEDGWDYCKLLCEETAVVSRPLEEEKRRYYDVAVSASITGFVRAYLWRNICATNGTQFYCDTDSIAAMDVHNISIAPGLGNWELEAECDYAAIAGKKLYAFRKTDGKWKTASKGVRLDPAEIVAIAKGETITHEPKVPTFSIKRGIKFTPRRIKMLETENGIL